MTKDKALRIAPQRNGAQIASAWRIWAQANEFYVAARETIGLGKISFHSSGKWQYRFGTQVVRLASPLSMSDNWSHCIELSFLIGEGILMPIEQREDKVILFETPVGHKLAINILRSSRKTEQLNTPPREIGGTILGKLQLINDIRLLVIGRSLPLTEADNAIISDTRTKLRLNFEKLPKENEIYIEANWCNFSPTTGNVVAVIPVGTETLAESR